MSSLKDWLGEAIPDVIMDDAAGWLSLLDSEESHLADRLAFARWLEADPRHRLAFEELSEVWAKLQILTDVPPLLEHPDVIRFADAKGPADNAASVESTRQRPDWSAAIAVTLVALGSMLHMLLDNSGETYSTVQGETADVVLQDGSKVELNSETRLDVRIDEQRRDVRLLAGEAVFHVAKDHRPFLVFTEQGTIAALGTSFAVDTSDGLLEVSVLEGLVSVSGGQSKMPLTEFDGVMALKFTDEAERLAAGERLQISGTSRRYETDNNIDFARDLAWRDGYVIFEDQRLQAAISDMRKYADLHIHLANPELGDLRISGRFATTDTNGFLALLQEKYKVSVDLVNDDFIVLRSQADQVLNN